MDTSLTIRLATSADVPAIQAIYAPVVRETVISFELEPPSLAEMGQRVGNTLRYRPWLVGESAGEIIGYAYAGGHCPRAAYQWSADVSIYLASGQRGKGFGKALYEELFDRLRRQGYYNVYAGITLPNAASRGLHEAMGMTPVGVYRAVGYKMGAWHDVGWWQGSLRPTSEAPGKIRALAEIT